MTGFLRAETLPPALHQHAGYRLVAWLFLRLLALIYLAAFASLAIQIQALAGAGGIFPIVEQLAGAVQEHGSLAWLAYPSFFWLAAGDGALLGAAWGGAMVAMLLLVLPWLPMATRPGGLPRRTRRARLSGEPSGTCEPVDLAELAEPSGKGMTSGMGEPCEPGWTGGTSGTGGSGGTTTVPAAWMERTVLLLLYLLYLSLYHAGQFFTNFQWDYLLLETGFLAMLLPGGPRLVVWLFRWLLFRLRFESGLAKLLSGDPAWRDLSALRYYFETQPLPHAGAWYAHHLPDALLRVGAGGTLFVELVVPFFIFLPRPWRLFAAWVTILWQVLIIATSNHNFFNLLTIILCLFLFDDQAVRRVLPRGWRERALASHLLPVRPGRGMAALTLGLALVLVTTSLIVGAELVFRRSLDPLSAWVRPLEPFRIANRYHVFPTIERRRVELVMEASADGVNWQPLDFRYRPDDPAQAPVFIVPHQPRLDWMLWFLPRNPVFLELLDRFLDRLRAGDPAVTALLARPPVTQGSSPWLRLSLYQYRFSSPAERSASGQWWQRDYLGPFLPLPFRG